MNSILTIIANLTTIAKDWYKDYKINRKIAKIIKQNNDAVIKRELLQNLNLKKRANTKENRKKAYVRYIKYKDK